MKSSNVGIPAILLLAQAWPAWGYTPEFARPALAGPGGAGFASEIEAVAAAANLYNPLSIRQDREYMGGILSGGARYYYTVSAGGSGSDQVQARIRVPRGFKLVAFWHTHGAPAPARRYFSNVDTRLAREWNMPFYLADYTGELKVFVPGDGTLLRREAARLDLPAQPGFALGRAVEDAHGNRIRVRFA